VLEHVVWLYSELGIDPPVIETIEDLSVIIADEQMSCGEGSSMSLTPRPGAPGGGGSTNSDNPYDAILARYVSRVSEGDDEAFETLGVEGVDPTLDVMEYFDSLKTEVSSQRHILAYFRIEMGLTYHVSILARLSQISTRIKYSKHV
jgi:hypothetical protein